MSPLPAETPYSSPSWEVVETRRRAAAAEVDFLIAATTCCDCPHETAGIEHFDALYAAVQGQHQANPGHVVGLAVEAVARLAAARVGGDSS